MKLHFAYGSNMSRLHMAVRCPQGVPLGTAILRGWRFVIGSHGYASIVQEGGSRVYGVLWRLNPRDLAALNAYENIQGGLYRVCTLPVRRQPPVNALSAALAARAGNAAGPVAALVYIGRRDGFGTARPGYMEPVLDAGREWNLPKGYLRELARWAPARWRSVAAPEPGEAA